MIFMTKKEYKALQLQIDDLKRKVYDLEQGSSFGLNRRSGYYGGHVPLNQVVGRILDHLDLRLVRDQKPAEDHLLLIPKQSDQ